MKKKSLLIATTNEGKAKEIKQILADLPFDFVSLNDLDQIPEAPEEIGDTLEQNALLKATYYAKKTGMLALADDSGLFIEALENWPGIRSARVAQTDDDRCNSVLEKMQNKNNRNASFQSVVCVYDPHIDAAFSSYGSIALHIATEMPTERLHGHGYDPILIDVSSGRALDEMSLQEKNAISHRGKAMSTAKRYLINQFRGKHFVVPIAFVVKDGLLLMNKRNDPHNPKYHGIWEFPGGSVEMGENVEEATIKECREETGYEVEIVAQLCGPKVKTYEYDSGPCQFYILPYICKVVGGQLSPSDTEVLESSWMSYDDALALKKFPGDTELMEEVRSTFENLVNTHNL